LYISSSVKLFGFKRGAISITGSSA
jgi:hypothetical protein